MVQNSMQLVICMVLVCSIGLSIADRDDEEQRAKKWLKEYDRLAQINYYNVTIASWNYATNITEHNSVIKVRLLHYHALQ